MLVANYHDVSVGRGIATGAYTECRCGIILEVESSLEDINIIMVREITYSSPTKEYNTMINELMTVSFASRLRSDGSGQLFKQRFYYVQCTVITTKLYEVLFLFHCKHLLDD